MNGKTMASVTSRLQWPVSRLLQLIVRGLGTENGMALNSGPQAVDDVAFDAIAPWTTSIGRSLN